jgi:hypothetical protein
MEYSDIITNLYSDVYGKLINWDISEKIIKLEEIGRKRTPPTGVTSQFLMNRALGDWAETAILNAFNTQFPDFLASKYGNSDNIIAGDSEFKSFFYHYVEELGQIGKRPDILIFKKDHNTSNISNDISNENLDDLGEIVQRSKYGIEVRSSKIKVKKYNTYRKDNLGIKSARKELSITPKVEDLPLVVQWIKTYKIQHFYFQACLDEVYGISFKKVLEFILNSSKKSIIEKNANNKEKATIHIPFSNAVKIGIFTEEVKFDCQTYEDERGRINPYIKPLGGKLLLDEKAVKQCFADL